MLKSWREDIRVGGILPWFDSSSPSSIRTIATARPRYRVIIGSNREGSAKGAYEIIVSTIPNFESMNV